MSYQAPTITASGKTFAQLQASGVSGLLEALITANNVATANPSAAPTSSLTGGGRSIVNPTVAETASASGGGSSGGTLAAGTYQVAYTWVHAHGETTIGASQSTTLTAASGNIPQVTIPALPSGAVSANIYLTNVSVPAGPLVLFKTGVTTTTTTLNSATWNGGTFAAGKAPPTHNTTIGGLLPGVYLVSFTEGNGIGETTAAPEIASSFTVASQTNPTTAATGAGSSTSGFLPAGAYFFAYTYVDAFGNETTIGTSEVASAVTISAGNILTITFGDTFPGWADSRNVYLSVAGGVSGSETLYATGVAGTATTLVASSALWVNGTVAASAARVVPAASTASVDIPQITFPTLQTGNTYRNLYATAPGGATGTETLYATGITASTFDMSYATPTNSLLKMVPPTTNSTAFSSVKLDKLRKAENGNLQKVYDSLRQDVRNFDAGDPIAATQAVGKIRDAHLVLLTLAQVASEYATAFDANPGTLTIGQNTIGNSRLKRQWP